MSTELIVQDNGVIAKAELDVQITTAKAYPRNISKAMDYAIQLATMDEAIAQSCFYCLPRKDKDGNKKEVRGGSIRLAEIMMQAWGNLHTAVRIIGNDGRSITTEGLAWDLENNNKSIMPNKTSIWFGEKNGKGGYQANADMQIILTNASCAKALRNAIFKVIPKALVDRVLEKAMSFSVGDQKTINTKVTELVDKLVKQGINKEALLEYYGYKSIGELTSDDFKTLIGVGTAIKEGYIKPEEVFTQDSDGNEGMSATEKLSNLIHEKKLLRLETGEVNDSKQANQ